MISYSPVEEITLFSGTIGRKTPVIEGWGPSVGSFVSVGADHGLFAPSLSARCPQHKEKAPTAASPPPTNPTASPTAAFTAERRTQDRRSGENRINPTYRFPWQRDAVVEATWADSKGFIADSNQEGLFDVLRVNHRDEKLLGTVYNYVASLGKYVNAHN